MAAIARKDERGFYHATNYNLAVDWVRVVDVHRLQPGRSSVIGRALLAMQAVQIADVLDDPEYSYLDMQKAAGFRTLLGVPLIRGDEPVGALFLGRKTVQPFTEKQVELVSTFADQAVIAIENARLFDEVKARTEDLQESLRQQTATANVLKAISRSAFDLESVLKALVEAAGRLSEADQGTIARQQDAAFVRVATWGFSDRFTELVQHLPVEPRARSGSPSLLAPSRRTTACDAVFSRSMQSTILSSSKVANDQSIAAGAASTALPLPRNSLAIPQPTSKPGQTGRKKEPTRPANFPKDFSSAANMPKPCSTQCPAMIAELRQPAIGSVTGLRSVVMKRAPKGSPSIAVFAAMSEARHCRKISRSVSIPGQSGCGSVAPCFSGGISCTATARALPHPVVTRLRQSSQAWVRA